MKIESDPYTGVGKVKILLDQIDSTQTFATQLLQDAPVTHGTLVLARYQTSGQGRLGRVWQSQAGENFTGSLILKHDWLNIPPPFLLSQTAALAIHNLVEELSGQSCKIKWPNDVICSNKKIAGILISNQWKGTVWESSIVGIGININQRKFDADLPQAISLAQLRSGEISMNEVVQGLLYYFNQYYLKLSKGDFDFITQRYFDLLYGAEVPITLKLLDSNRTFSARVLSIDSSGKITVKLDAVDIQSFDLDQISIQLA